MYSVITTVGTSIFYNYCEDEKNSTIKVNKVKQFLKEVQRARHSDWKNFDNEYIDDIKRCILKWAKDNEDASAEIKSLKQIQKALDDNLDVFLIATDTISSPLAAEIIKESMADEKINFCEGTNVIKGLQVDSRDEFDNEGMQNLIDTINKIVEKISKKHNRKDNIIFNISGGYKAVIPYLTILGQLVDIPLYYIYEDSSDLIVVPRLPISFDWMAAEIHYPYLFKERLACSDYHNDKVMNDLVDLRILKLSENNSKYVCTALGKMYKEFIKQSMPMSRDVLGHFIEYKILEYYARNTYRAGGKEYKYLERSKKIKKQGEQGEGDIDVFMAVTNEEDSPFICIESKVFCQIEAAKGQIEKNLEILKSQNKMPDEYHLCACFTSRNQRLEDYDCFFSEISKSIKQTNPGCVFKVYGIKIITDLERKGITSYQSFVDEPLTEKTFRLYKEF